jgi:hypothetical protein
MSVHDTIDITNSVMAVNQITASALESMWARPKD